MLAIIDCDSIVYAAGYSAQRNRYTLGNAAFRLKRDMLAYADEHNLDPASASFEVEADPVEFALSNARNYLAAIQSALPECTQRLVYLTEGAGYREGISESYKANRNPNMKPVHYSAIREYLVQHWDANIISWLEADDQCCIDAWSMRNAGKPEDYVVCGIDKDLLQIPGQHYNYRTRQRQHVTEQEAWRYFFTQVLMGDKIDNVPGIPGIGPKKAEVILRDKTKPRAMYMACLQAYRKSKVPLSQFYKNCEMLYLLRSMDDHWTVPK